MRRRRNLISQFLERLALQKETQLSELPALARGSRRSRRPVACNDRFFNRPFRVKRFQTIPTTVSVRIPATARFSLDVGRAADQRRRFRGLPAAPPLAFWTAPSSAKLPLVGCATYVRGDVDDPGSYDRLRQALQRIEAERGTKGNRLFYMATPPSAFRPIACQLGRSRLACEENGSWRRIIIEKPFGTDLTSARKLNNDLLDVFDENQLYRIDHYLGASPSSAGRIAREMKSNRRYFVIPGGVIARLSLHAARRRLLSPAGRPESKHQLPGASATEWVTELPL
jgi:hypothetical protein